MGCACNGSGGGASSDEGVRVRTATFTEVAETANLAEASLTSASAAAQAAVAAARSAAAGGEGPLVRQVHLLDGGSLLVSSAYAEGNAGDVVLRGSIGPIPYEIHVRFEMEDGVVVVTITVRKPIELGPFVLRFRLRGIRRDDRGNIVGASDVAADPDAPGLTASSVAALGLNWWCVLRCGGVAILAILVRCLPALAGGVPGYVACVTSQAGAGAAGIAACIAKKCV